ncbi:Ig-like domain-containing protein [Sporobacter termitidis]|uniref:Ig-like domain-containing protein n=1 Tax=Sporobacter termitidis TaxID=44749 RepID=UPI001A9A6C05|nr:Ig-like domain-containing protein [Sporobacter termitidis]
MPKKTHIRRALALITALIAAALLSGTTQALDDDEFGGYAADTLTVRVGYFGGPYYEKHVFTLEELRGMDLVQADYTFIDNMPSVVIDHVEGVRLADVMDAAGIDLNSVQNFYFYTKDKSSGYFTTFSKKSLIDTPRYCYYSLPDNFDADSGRGNEHATENGVRVDTVLALGDDWNRVIAGAAFGSDYLNLNSNTRFRLVYGQKDAVTRTASDSAKWVHAINVDLGGAPTVTLDQSVLDLKVGSVFRSEARVMAADPVISQNAKVEWRSSDDSVASVDDDGSITVHADGTAVITASFMGQTAAVTVNGQPGEGASGSGASGSGTSGAGGGQGDGSGNAGGKPAVSAAPAGVEIKETTQENAGQVPLNQSSVKSEGDAGGVQNWRVYEMAKDAVALPVIREDNPLLPVIGALAAALFAGGVLYRVLKFKFDMGDHRYVFIRKPK